MTTRRDFIRSSVAASTGIAAAVSGWRAASAFDRPTLRFERFVLDVRFADSVAAGRLAAERGIALAETAGDLTSLWYHDLDLRWRLAPMTLAGVTTKGALFVLETLAADRGMRVLYRGEHGAASDALTLHTPAGRSDLFAELLPSTLRPGVAARADRSEPLVSWIIAPRAAVAAAV